MVQRDEAGPQGGGLLKSPQDFAAGLFLLAFAAIAFYGAWDLRFGQLRGIGPGLMPKVTAVVVGAFGLLLVVTSLFTRGSALERWSLRGPFFILGAVLLFALTIRGASFPQWGIEVPSLGLIVAGPLAVIFSAFADKDTRPVEVVIYAAVITALCIGLFKMLLRLPIPIAPWLLGY